MLFEDDFQEIFHTMTGALTGEFQVAWVRNAWEDDTGFKKAYEEFGVARENLCRRFGMAEDDADLERFMNGSLQLEEDLCRRMFYCGILYAKRGCHL